MFHFTFMLLYFLIKYLIFIILSIEKCDHFIINNTIL